MANKRTSTGTGNSSAASANRNKAKAPKLPTSGSVKREPMNIDDALKRLVEAGVKDTTNSDDSGGLAIIGYPPPQSK